VIDARSGTHHSYSIPGGKVALTFDDGPGPERTPQILAQLPWNHVPGTFFLAGARVAEYPDLVRAEVAAGGRPAHRGITGIITRDHRSDISSLVQFCRSAGIGIGTARSVDPVPTPFWQLFGGNVVWPRDEGAPAAQNM
jgi:peptidoglycan/xylan/chitin deacetylase (PgdA/CDA1 family)